MTYIPTPTFIYGSSDSRKNNQIDFFCKTEENKTQLEEKYCNDYFESENRDDYIGSIILLIAVCFAAYAIWEVNQL